MQEIVVNIANTLNETDDAAIYVMGGEEYGGTYDRPWILQTYKLLNDRGETVQHGR